MKRALLSMLVRRRRNERVRLEPSDSAEPLGGEAEVGSAIVEEPNLARNTSPRVRNVASDEARAAELHTEIEELQQLLEARTEAWRQARDQLSAVRIQISEVSQHPSTNRRIEPLADRDWARLQGDSPSA
jgi:chromosome segregation ATPase